MSFREIDGPPPRKLTDEEQAERRHRAEQRRLEREAARQEAVHGEPLSHRLWRLRFLLEDQRGPGDPSLVWLGDLANVLEEHDVANVEQLQDRLADSEFLREERRGL